MVECDYCDGSFADEDEYLVHLRDAHEGELGSIDRRRVEDLESDDEGLSTGAIALGVVVVLAAGLAAYTMLIGGSGDGPPTDLPDSGDQAVISQVEHEPAESAQHVQSGTDIDYSTMPPTGGAHYPTAADAGFYEESPPLGNLVHSLEHGAIIVWYDPAAMTNESEESMRAFASAHRVSFGSFIAVPTPVEDPEHPFVLTAWEYRLPMDEYDHETVRQFSGEYLGRGPENPTR